MCRASRGLSQHVVYYENTLPLVLTEELFRARGYFRLHREALRGGGGEGHPPYARLSMTVAHSGTLSRGTMHNS